jgi:hypothetical protein
LARADYFVSRAASARLREIRPIALVGKAEQEKNGMLLQSA